MQIAQRRMAKLARSRISRRFLGKVGGSLSELPGPVDGVDVNAERIFAQTIGVVQGFKSRRSGSRSTLGGGERAILVSALDPGDAERFGEARMTLETSTEICILPRLAKGSLVRAKSFSAAAPRSVVKS